MPKVKLKDDLIIRGEVVKKDQIIEVNLREHIELTARGVAEDAEPTTEVEIDVDEDNMTPLEDMKKNDLVEYASSLGIDVPSKATKEQIIELVNAYDEDEQE